MAKPIPLSKDEITNIIIKRASGAKQKDLASHYGISDERLLNHQRKYHDSVLGGLVIEKDSFSIVKSNNTNEYPALWIKGDLIASEIKQTGNLNDGIIYAGGVYCDYDCFDEEDGYELPSSLELTQDYSFDENDIGLLKTLVVGKVVIHSTTYDSNIEYEKTSSPFNSSNNWYLKPESKIANEVLSRDLEPINDQDELIKEDEPVVEEKQPVEYLWNASNKFISITYGREAWNADSSHINFKQALKALVDGNVEEALTLINVKKAIERYVGDNIVIENGVLTYEGYVLNNGLTNRIIESMSAGEDFEFYLPFLKNLMMNPSNKAVNRLFDFLEANDIAITPDGFFIAWKVVTKDYLDCRTKTFDNSPGKPVFIPRNQVDENDLQTCSYGLHVCSKSYIPEYRSDGDKVVSVKVHPKDVVSVPVDYNNSKMRTCGYVVLEDVTNKF